MAHYNSAQYSSPALPRWPPGKSDPAYQPVKITEVPGEDPAEVPAYRRKSFRQRWFGGLRLTLRAFAVAAVLVLIVNIAVFVWARNRFGISRGYGTIQQGNCASVKRLNTWLHLAINVLSTLLLCGSNAFMQAFSGPTRQEVDAAHYRRRWLHIGVLGFRNLRGIAKRKAFICLLLGMTSIPFHLLYNSLVFTTLSATQYYWAVVTEEFLTGAPFNVSDPAFAQIQSQAQTYKRLNPAECITTYADDFSATRRHVLIISGDKDDTNSILASGSAEDNEYDRWHFWMCNIEEEDMGPDTTCNINVTAASSWQIKGHPVEYCLSEPIEGVCSLQFSFTIIIVVIAFNATKLAAMLWVLFRLDAEKLLVSVGDAMASFLAFEDRTTFGMCLADKPHIDKFWREQSFAKPYNDKAGRWGWATSKKRRWLFNLMMVFAAAIVALLLAWGISSVKSKGINPTSLGFGSLNASALVFADSAGSPISMAVLANTPQLILSILYMAYQGIMTSTFLAVDWSAFAFKPQTLMVGSPTGEQRGTWLLGAPLPYGIGLLGMQTLLHWFISQSIFAVQLNILLPDGTPDTSVWASGRYSNCGFSPIAIYATLATAGLMLIFAYLMGLRKFKRGSPPVVSTCSAAISAACHPDLVFQDDALPYEKLQWGTLRGEWNGVGHCAMMPEKAWKAGQMMAPIPGRFYAGRPRDPWQCLATYRWRSSQHFDGVSAIPHPRNETAYQR